jgi:hypothetical protein
MTTPMIKRPLTLLAALLTLTTLAGTAQAQEPFASDADRSLVRQARGQYVLEDGRVLLVRVGEHRLDVSVDAAPTEQWRAASADLLVSPDGRRRLRLLREADGSVERIELETDKLR